MLGRLVTESSGNLTPFSVEALGGPCAVPDGDASGPLITGTLVRTVRLRTKKSYLVGIWTNSHFLEQVGVRLTSDDAVGIDVITPPNIE